jgi:hypothetical protein
MKQTKRALSAAFVLGFAIAASTAYGIPANAAQIKASGICKNGASYCIAFNNTGVIPLAGAFTFNAPTAGTALVSFNGSMQCSNFSTDTGSTTGVVDLTAQILTSAAQTPDYQGPGGSRIKMRLAPAKDDFVLTRDNSAFINLASSRVLPLTAGAHGFVFKIVRKKMDALTSCIVFNGDFKVVFVP